MRPIRRIRRVFPGSEWQRSIRSPPAMQSCRQIRTLLKGCPPPFFCRELFCRPFPFPVAVCPIHSDRFLCIFASVRGHQSAFFYPHLSAFPFALFPTTVNPCPSVPIYGQVDRTLANTGFLERTDGHCQRNCQ